VAGRTVAIARYFNVEKETPAPVEELPQEPVTGPPLIGARESGYGGLRVKSRGRAGCGRSGDWVRKRGKVRVAKVKEKLMGTRVQA